MVRHLRTHLAANGGKMKEYKEAIHLLNGKVNDQKAKVTQLEGDARRVKELAKTNANLRTELVVLCEQVDKAKANIVEVFKDSQPYFDELEGQYKERFEDFRKQAILIFHG